MNRNAKNATPIVAQATQTVNAFDVLKRDYETAYAADPAASGDKLTALATAVAYSVVGKLIDPQRKTAAERQTVSASGLSPAMVDLRRGIAADRSLLDGTRRNMNAATAIAYNADGDAVRTVVDADADRAAAALVSQCLTDGIDLVQTAALALWEQSTEHAAGTGWLDTPYTVHRLSRRVYIQLDESAAYRETETTPIQEAFRAVRHAVENSRAVQTDPRNGYMYLDELTEDGLDTIYRRLGRYADVGGYAVNGHVSDMAGTPAGYGTGNGLCTADAETARTMAELVAALDLTAKQARVLKYRLQGYGYKAIATACGVSDKAIKKTVLQIQTRAAAIGLCPLPPMAD